MLEQASEVSLLLRERDLVVATQQPANHAAVAVLEEGQLGAVTGAAHVKASDEATFADLDVGDVVGEHQLFARARQDEVVGVEAVALVHEAALELLLKIFQRKRVELLDDRLGAEPGDALFGG